MANELVDVPVDFKFVHAADLVRLYEAPIVSKAVKSITRSGVGLYDLNLDESWPWLISDSLKTSSDSSSTAAPFVVKVCYTGSESNYQGAGGQPPKVRLQVFDLAGALADPATDVQLVGFLTFRNRLTGM